MCIPDVTNFVHCHKNLPGVQQRKIISTADPILQNCAEVSTLIIKCLIVSKLAVLLTLKSAKIADKEGVSQPNIAALRKKGKPRLQKNQHPTVFCCLYLLEKSSWRRIFQWTDFSKTSSSVKLCMYVHSLYPWTLPSTYRKKIRKVLSL